MTKDERATDPATGLEMAYADAFDEWRSSGEESAWEATVADGLDESD